MTKEEKIGALQLKGIDCSGFSTQRVNKEYQNLFERDEPEIKKEEPEEIKKPDPDEIDGFEKLTEEIENAQEIKEKEEGAIKPPIKRTRAKKKRGESDPDYFRIEGYILLVACDVVFPGIMVLLNNKILKRQKIDIEQLQLDEKEGKKLEPLANQCADYLMIHMNPIWGFTITAGILYGNHYIKLTTRMNNKTIGGK